MHYLEDGRLEFSNNRAERSMKLFVMGRKKWLFAKTAADDQSSTVSYSLIETAKENDLDPFLLLPGLAPAQRTWGEPDRYDIGKFFPRCGCSTGMRNSESDWIKDRHLNAWAMR